MTGKENKGGTLKNDQIEQDLKAKGRTPEGNDAYIGSQDTGDKVVRHLGNDVQRNDGHPAEQQSEE